MTDAQKKVASEISLGVVGLTSIAAVLFAIFGLSGNLIGERWPGHVFLSAAALSETLSGMLRPLGAIVIFGIAYIGTRSASPTTIRLTSFLILAAVLSCAALLYVVADVGFAADLWGTSYVATIQDYAQLQAASRPFLLWYGGGLIASLLALLGLSPGKKE